jgi:hypothetical protein
MVSLRLVLALKFHSIDSERGGTLECKQLNYLDSVNKSSRLKPYLIVVRHVGALESGVVAVGSHGAAGLHVAAALAVSVGTALGIELVVAAGLVGRAVVERIAYVAVVLLK